VSACRADLRSVVMCGLRARAAAGPAVRSKGAHYVAVETAHTSTLHNFSDTNSTTLACGPSDGEALGLGRGAGLGPPNGLPGRSLWLLLWLLLRLWLCLRVAAAADGSPRDDGRFSAERRSAEGSVDGSAEQGRDEVALEERESSTFRRKERRFSSASLVTPMLTMARSRPALRLSALAVSCRRLARRQHAHAPTSSTAIRRKAVVPSAAASAASELLTAGGPAAAASTPGGGATGGSKASPEPASSEGGNSGPGLSSFGGSGDGGGCGGGGGEPSGGVTGGSAFSWAEQFLAGGIATMQSCWAETVVHGEA